MSLGLAWLVVASHSRDLDTGDTAGFALGGFFLPISAIFLVAGSVTPRHPRAGLDRIMHRSLSALLVIFGLLFGGVYLIGLAPGAPARSMSSFHGVALLAFSATLLVCALLGFRSENTRRGRAVWISGALITLAILVAVQISGLTLQFVREGFLAVHLPWAVGPSLAWLGALVWAAWRVTRDSRVS